jgi:hypothetical protein
MNDLRFVESSMAKRAIFHLSRKPSERMNHVAAGISRRRR